MLKDIGALAREDDLLMVCAKCVSLC